MFARDLETDLIRFGKRKGRSPRFRFPRLYRVAMLCSPQGSQYGGSLAMRNLPIGQRMYDQTRSMTERHSLLLLLYHGGALARHRSVRQSRVFKQSCAVEAMLGYSS